MYEVCYERFEMLPNMRSEGNSKDQKCKGKEIVLINM